MVTKKLNKEELFDQLDETTSQLVELVASTDEKLLDVIPFENSWTVAQLASHITKSNKALAQALEITGVPAKRKADERVQELKKMFLDFTVKFNSPEFILPTKTIYSKNEVVEKLTGSVKQVRNIRDKINLTEVISLPAFGEITKFELLNFVVFHTTRHTHQLKNILHILRSKN